MIKIIDKRDCCGCTSCVSSCPRHCISLALDNEGFGYPVVNVEGCVNCGQCEKVCPILNVKNKRKPLKVLAVKNRDKVIIKRSSSGGVFHHIATRILKSDGVVFGARFDDTWQVVHDYATDEEGLRAFMTSKYVQSSIKKTYSQVRQFLNQGKKVLFTGTPCQVAGLHSFLHKDYENLYTVDFLCHGVPSPKVWGEYLNEIITEYYKSARRAADGKSSVLSHSLNQMSLIKDIEFREKGIGWKKFRFVLSLAEPSGEGKKVPFVSSIHKENPYMKGFLNDLYLRPSCHRCRFKRFQSQSDLTLGDYWSIGRVCPDFDDPMGVSMLFVNSMRGQSLLDLKCLEVVETSLKDTLSNKGLDEYVPEHPMRGYFFKHLDESQNVQGLIAKCVCLPFYKRVLKKFKKVLQ